MPDNTRDQINSLTKKTFSDALIYMPSKVLPAIVGVIFIKILTEVFSNEEYGLYQIIFATFGLLKTLNIGWLANSTIRFYSQYKNNSTTYFTSLCCSFVMGTVIVGIMFYVANIFFLKQNYGDDFYNLMNIAILAMFTNVFFEVFIVIYRADLKPKIFTIYWIYFAIGKPIVGLFFILFFGLSVKGIVLGMLIVPLILDIILCFKLHLNVLIKISNISVDLIKKFLQYGLPFVFTMLSFWILSFSDRYIIEIFCGRSAVGLYTVGFVISERILNFFYMILMLAAYPLIINNWEKNGKHSTQQLITEYTRYFFLLCMPILVILIMLPEPILLLLSNKKFLQGVSVIPLLSIAYFMKGLNMLVIKGFELTQKSYKIALIALLSGCLNIGLNIIIIPKLGFIGAGYSALITYSFHLLLSILMVKSDMAWKPHFLSIIKILLSGVIMGLLLVILKENISNIILIYLLVIPSGVIAFFTVVYLFKEINDKEIRNIFFFIKKIGSKL